MQHTGQLALQLMMGVYQILRIKSRNQLTSLGGGSADGSGFSLDCSMRLLTAFRTGSSTCACSKNCVAYSPTTAPLGFNALSILTLSTYRASKKFQGMKRCRVTHVPSVVWGRGAVKRSVRCVVWLVSLHQSQHLRDCRRRSAQN